MLKKALLASFLALVFLAPAWASGKDTEASLDRYVGGYFLYRYVSGYFLYKDTEASLDYYADGFYLYRITYTGGYFLY